MSYEVTWVTTDSKGLDLELIKGRDQNLRLLQVLNTDDNFWSLFWERNMETHDEDGQRICKECKSGVIYDYQCSFCGHCSEDENG